MKYSMNGFKLDADRKKIIDVTGLSWCEMAVLKKKDPFMYYSIPGTRDTTLPGEEIDLSGLDLPSGDVSRSFTVGSAKDKNEHESKTSRRTRRGLSASLSLQCPSFAINEEKKREKPRSTTSRCKSPEEIISTAPGPKCHRHMSTAPAVESNLVERRSVISFESYDLDDIIDKVAKLKPQEQQASTCSINPGEASLRGSLLQDILFNSIAHLADLEEFGSDSD